jgi:DNA-binding IclR family transcriptional regulator
MRMISRASSILRAIAEQPAGLSLGQLAKSTGLARATVQRLVGALEAEGLVSTTPNLPGVRLGVELARLGSAVHSDIRSLIRPALEQLHRRVEDTVDLTILNGAAAVVIDQIASPHALRVVSHIGQALPLHCTASGKAHLTQLTATQITQFVRPPLRRYTGNTNTDAGACLALAETASLRLSQFDFEECFDGVAAISLPIRGSARGNYAISISMPVQRLIDRRDLLTEELLRAQSDIESMLGDFSRTSVLMNTTSRRQPATEQLMHPKEKTT